MRRLLLLVGLVLLGTAGFASTAMDAPRVEQFTPTGTAREVRQVAVRFSAPMVAFGDRRARDPFEIDCAAPGAGHWIDARNWVYDLEREAPSGLRCRFTLGAGTAALDGRPLGPGARGDDRPAAS